MSLILKRLILFFDTFENKIPLICIGRLIPECCKGKYVDLDNVMLLRILDWCTQRKIDFSTFTFTNRYLRGIEENAVESMIIECVKSDRINTLRKVREIYNIDVPIRIHQHSESHEMTEYIQQHGI